MEFKLKYAKSVKKNLKSIDRQYHSAIKSAIEKLQESPKSKSEKVKDPNLPERKIRVGNYRVLFDINDDDKIVEIQKIAHRKKVYE